MFLNVRGKVPGADPYPSGAHLHPIAIPARVSGADSTPIGQSVFGVHPA